jgi:ribosomal protein S18 acetylase RimI-like enzyme
MEKGIKFREAKEEDIESIVELVIRLKRLNEEFDALLKVREDIVEQTKLYIKNSLKSDNSFIVVAEYNKKIVGILKAEVRERLFYSPTKEGFISEFYIMPEFRRKGLGKDLLKYSIEKLKDKGAEIVTAEFPTQNKIATDFYAKQGFRSVISIHARYID